METKRNLLKETVELVAALKDDKTPVGIPYLIEVFRLLAARIVVFEMYLLRMSIEIDIGNEKEFKEVALEMCSKMKGV